MPTTLKSEVPFTSRYVQVLSVFNRYETIAIPLADNANTLQLRIAMQEFSRKGLAEKIGITDSKMWGAEIYRIDLRGLREEYLRK